MTFKLNKFACKVVSAFLINVLLAAMVSADSKVGVIIPELREPFKVIFDTVGSGIDDGLRTQTPKLMLKKNYDPQSISRWIKKENINAVITLGGAGQKATMYIPKNIPVMLGALLSSPGATNKVPGIALTPNPKSLFALLQRLDNKRSKVVVVYNPEKNQWIVDLAKRQAAANGVRLVSHKATDLKQAAIIYHNIFDSSELDSTAIWLLQDRKVVDSKVVLPFILEQAWQKKIVVFSSALSHVKKGVLFSMYPDNASHGKQLAELMLKQRVSSVSASNQLYPTEGLQDAINSRTAEHLGLSVSRSELREFDVVFPLSN